MMRISMSVCFGGMMALLALAMTTGVQEPVKDPESLIERLGSDDYAERRAAVDALSKAGEKALPLLEKAVQSDDPEVKLLAAEAMAKLRLRARITPRVLQEHPEILEQAISGNEDDCHKLLEDLTGLSIKDFDNEGRKWFVSHRERSYLFVDRKSLSTILESITSESRDDVLRRFSRYTVGRYLLTAYLNPSYREKIEKEWHNGPIIEPRYGGRIGQKKEAPIVKLLSDTDEQWRRTAEKALNGATNSERIEALGKLLEHFDGDVQGNAVRLLQQIGTREAIPALTSKVDNPSLKRSILYALRIIGSRDSEETFVRQLQHHAPLAIMGLIQLKSSKANATIKQLLEAHRDDEEIVFYGIDGFGKTGYRDGLSLVEQYVRHIRPSLRSNALRAVGRIGETTKLDDLLFFADDIEGPVREAAAVALARLNKGKWLPMLKEVLDDTPSDIYGCSEVVLRYGVPEVFKKLAETPLTLTGELKEVNDILPVLGKATGITFRGIGVDHAKMRLPLCLFERPFTVLEILEYIDANGDGHIAFVYRDDKIDLLTGDAASAALREAVKSIKE